MRILHIVTLVSPEGELGGPLRVAVNQLRELQERGHEVLLAGAARGFDALPDSYDGVPVKLFPAVTAVPGTGFAGLSAPGMIPWLVRNARSFDVIHLHMARDLVLAPAATVLSAAGRKLFVQPHGMIDSSEKRLAKALDALCIRRVLTNAAGLFALTEQEARDLQAVAPGCRPEVLPNGIDARPESSARPDQSQEVLFLARMAPRKRPLDLAEAALPLLDEFPEMTVRFVGPDEGEAPALEVFLASHPALEGRIAWEGSLPPSATQERMSSAGVYVLPAENEPFGMTVIEAQLTGLPVVVRSDCGLAESVLQSRSGLVYDGGVSELTDRLRELLSEPQQRVELGQRGRVSVQENFGISRVGDILEKAYTGIPSSR